MDLDEFDSSLSVAEVLEEYFNMLKDMCERSSRSETKESFTGAICEQDEERKVQFISANHINAVSQALLEYLVLLDWQAKDKEPKLSPTSIYTSILRLENSLSKISTWELLDLDSHGPLNAVTEFEVTMTEEIVSSYLEHVFQSKVDDSAVLFFPLNNPPEPEALVTWRILEKIATVNVASKKTKYISILKEGISQKTTEESEFWFAQKLQAVKMGGKSTVLDNVKDLTKMAKDLNHQLSNVVDFFDLVKPMFEAVNSSYGEALTQAVRNQLYPVCKKTLETLDIYNECHKEFHVNIRNSSAACHAMFLQIKRMIYLINQQLKKESAPQDQLREFIKLFENAFFHLLHAMKIESHSRIKRAMDSQEADTALEEQHITSSTVIVLNCLCTLLDEWKKLEIEEDDMKIAFLVKITDIVCDGAVIFAESLAKRSFHQGETTKPDYLKKANKNVAILGNSVEHVQNFLSDLPRIMDWENILDRLISFDENNDEVKEQIQRILTLVYDNMNTRLREIQRKLHQTMINLILDQSGRLANPWLQDKILRTAGHQSLDKLLTFLHEQLEVVHEVLNEENFKWFLQELWLSLLRHISEAFLEGKSPNYSRIVKKNVEDLHKYFVSIKMAGSEENDDYFQQVMKRIDLNAKTTVQLQLELFGQTADNTATPTEYFGHIVLQTGYKKSGRNTVDICVKVQKIQKLPVRMFPIEQIQVSLELCPKFLFPSIRAVHSHSVTEDLQNPIFNKTFHFSKLPTSVLSVDGAVIAARVTNQDGGFNAEAILRLSSVQSMAGLSSVDYLPVHLLTLKKFDPYQPCYQVLNKRKKKDRQARRFIAQCNEANQNQSRLLACLSASKPLDFFHTRHQSFRNFWKK